MVRRSTHTAEQLRELVLQAATDLIEEHGLSGLSAREIAKRINYSPGTLYNIFENLDDLIFRVEERVLDHLDDQLNTASTTQSDEDQIRKIVDVYVQFATRNPKLWNILLQHQLSNRNSVPAWYQEKFDRVQSRFEAALAAVSGPAADETDIKASAKALLYSIHGVTALSTANKFAELTDTNTAAIVNNLITTYCNQLANSPHYPEKMSSK